MEITVEDARDLLMDDLEGWKVIEEINEGLSRWEVHYTSIVKNEESGKHYSIDWSCGATEVQDTRPFEYSEPKLIEVRPVEVITIGWEPVEVSKSTQVYSPPPSVTKVY